MKKHKWTKKETQIALYAYIKRMAHAEVINLAADLEIKRSAFFMRMSNFMWLDTGGKKGLSAIKKLEQEVWDEYCKNKNNIYEVWDEYCKSKIQ